MPKKATTQQILETISDQYAMMITEFTTVKQTVLDVQAEIIEARRDREGEGKRYLEHLSLMSKLGNKIDEVVLGLNAYATATKELAAVQKAGPQLKKK